MTDPTAIMVVTGARDWDGDPDLITGSLRDFAARHPGHRLVLFHGDCPGDRSVDQLAAARAEHLGFDVIPFPAPFRRFGKVAGPCRNEVMCASAARMGPDVVEAHGFPMPDSTGTADCLRAARACGLHGTEHRRRERG